MKAVKLLALAGMLAIPMSAAADDDRIQEAVDTRQGLLKVVRSYFGPVYAMAGGHIPYDAAVVEKNGEALAALLPMINDVFRMDTSEADVASGALDGIWENWDDFAEKAAASAEKAAALAATAGNEDDTKAAFRALGGSCKACHDQYREQD